MGYLGGVVDSMFTLIFIAFAIGAIGYAIGGISIKGISLGSAGVLLAALLYGVLVVYVPSFTIGGKTVELISDSLIAGFGVIKNMGTALFVTAVGYIAGPKFFRTMNRKSLAYIVMGIAVIGTGAAVALGVVYIFGVEPAMVVGLLAGGLTSTPGLSAATEGVTAAQEAAASAGYAISYIYGVLGVVLFVQLMPRIMRVDIAKEREYRMILLEAQNYNIPAIDFYRSQGFKFCGANVYFYSNEDIEDDEVMIEMAYLVE